MSEADVTDLQFVQSGFILKCILSHDITLVSTVEYCYLLALSMYLS